jgi:hypothetical protein
MATRFHLLHHLLPPHSTSSAYLSWFARTPIVNEKVGARGSGLRIFATQTSSDVAEVVVTASSRSEAGYELFRRPLRLSRITDPASPIFHWHRHIRAPLALFVSFAPPPNSLASPADLHYTVMRQTLFGAIDLAEARRCRIGCSHWYIHLGCSRSYP